VIAAKCGAHVAASTTPLLFTLGLNRLAQAAVIASRAMVAGIPFAPEKDGRTFLSGAFQGSDHDRSARY
jgi:C4-dicarboxylate transporter